MLKHVVARLTRYDQELEHLQGLVTGRLAGSDESHLHVPSTVLHGDYRGC